MCTKKRTLTTYRITLPRLILTNRKKVWSAFMNCAKLWKFATRSNSAKGKANGWTESHCDGHRIHVLLPETIDPPGNHHARHSRKRPGRNYEVLPVPGLYWYVRCCYECPR